MSEVDEYIEVNGHTYTHDEDCPADAISARGSYPRQCVPECRCDGRLDSNSCMGVINNEAQDCPACKRR